MAGISKRKIQWRIPLILIVMLSCQFVYGKVIYVDHDANGVNDGTSWVNAYVYLQDALADANSAEKPVEIRVAQGIYRANEGLMAVPEFNWRIATFQLINGVAIKGGYAGFGEPDPDARDIELYETILSGDLNGDDGPNFTNNDDNSYHVITGSGTDATAVLEGFIVTGGNADSSGQTNRGGGMYNNIGSPTITTCTFSGNSAGNGGGMCNDESSPTLTKCTFIGNLAGHGGGMCNVVERPMLINCTFRGNHASSKGGGLNNQFFGSPTLTNCKIIGNTAGVVGVSYGYGGGVYNRDGCNPILINCIITGNLAKGDSGGGGGGGICTRNLKIDSSQIFINCSFAGNTAPRGNSLSYDSLGKDFPSTVQLTNCIIWDGGNKIWNNDESTITITFSNVQGLIGGRSGLLEGNINAEPLFVDADGADDVIGTKDDDLRLLPGSPCIDAGDNSAIMAGVIVDLDGNPRIMNGIVDMGAYEGGVAPPPDVYYVDAVNGDNSNDGLTLETAFATIQKGIDVAVDGEVVLVYPGVYTGEINFLGKGIKVQGIATKAGIALIENPGDFGVSFYYGEGPDSVLKNFIIENSFMGIFIEGSFPTISNVTVVGNKYGIEAYAGAEPDISNSILWNNSDGDLFGCQARYSCIERGGEGEGNIDADPLFADLDNGDYHLKSQAGRWDPVKESWMIDEETSPCIDAGDPNSPTAFEPFPNGGIINMGAYGGTSVASKSP